MDSGDRRSNDVARALRSDIGELFPPGSRLPSEKKLTLRYDVSRNTVRGALALLATDGLLVRRWGAGTFVRSSDETGPLRFIDTDALPTVDIIRAAGHDPCLTYSDIRLVTASGTPAVSLGLDSRETMWSVDRVFGFGPEVVPVVHLIDHTARVINGRHIDPTSLKDVNHGGMLALIHEMTGARIIRSEGTFEAVLGSGREPELLGVTPGTPLIRSEFQAFDSRDNIVMHSEAYHRTDPIKLSQLRTPRQ